MRSSDPLCSDPNWEASKGCLAYNETRANLAARNFSAWLANSYSSESEAWAGVCGGSAERYFRQQQKLGLEARGVPFYAWVEVWKAWPHHRRAESSWQEVFHLADEDKSGVVDQAEFGRLYRRHDKLATVEHFFEEMREVFFDSGEACSAIAGAGGPKTMR